MKWPTMMTKLINSEHGDSIPLPYTTRMAVKGMDENYGMEEMPGSSSPTFFIHLCVIPS